MYYWLSGSLESGDVDSPFVWGSPTFEAVPSDY
jgi:hypothetical protein